MEVEEKLKVLARCLRELQGGEWSVREVLAFARAAGIKVREQTAYAVLYNYDLSGRKAAGRRRKTAPREAISDINKDSDKMLPGSNSGSNFHENPRARGEIKSNSDLSGVATFFTLTSFGAGTENGATRKARSVKKARKDADLSWIPGVESAVQSIALKALESLVPEERLALGRYHALHFGNCTREAIRNVTRGQNVAAGLTGMGSDYRSKDITVREYIAYARRVHKKRNGVPWFNPRLIMSEIEYEQA